MSTEKDEMRFAVVLWPHVEKNAGVYAVLLGGAVFPGFAISSGRRIVVYVNGEGELEPMYKYDWGHYAYLPLPKAKITITPFSTAFTVAFSKGG